MKEHLKKLWKPKPMIGIASMLAVTGTLIGTHVSDTTEPTRYVLAQVTRGTIVTSISGSGQVAAENQIDVKPTVSGTVLQQFVHVGDAVTMDQPLYEIERSDASKAVRNAEQGVRDAEISLEAAQISYEKLLQPDSPAAVLQATNALHQAERQLADLEAGPTAIEITRAETAVKQAEQNVRLASDGVTPKTVRDAYNTAVLSLKSLLLTTQDALDDADDVLAIDGASANVNFNHLFSVLDQSKKIVAYNAYPGAKDAIKEAQTAIDALALQNEDPRKIDSAIDLLQIALGKTTDLLNAVQQGLDASLTSSSFSQANLDSYKSTIHSDLSSVANGYTTLNTLRSSFENAQNTYDNATLSLTQAIEELADLKNGSDPDDIAKARETVEERTQALADVSAASDDISMKQAKNTISQRKSALQNAKDDLQDAYDELNDYTVRAPFDGVVAAVNARVGSEASPGAAMATVLTKGKIAEISLNEVDIANIRVGQKATLSFDAISGITIAGSVTEVALVGSASQGVVTYPVKISFLTDDDRIRPGMSVSASIITNVKQDALLVPTSAVQTMNGSSVVQTIENATVNTEAMNQGVTSATLPRSISVTTGLTNESTIEITDGLTEGETIVTRTITASAAKTTTSATGSSGARTQTFGAPVGGLGGGTGNFIRIQR